MYFWKCWRESRARFAEGVIAVATICVAVTIVESGTTAARVGTAMGPSPIWTNITATVLGGWASFFVLLWALLMGSAGVGQEFKDRTAAFLLTRPRRRRYWVWAGWSVGVLELTVLVFLAAVATLVTLALVTGGLLTWRPLVAIVPLVIGPAVIFGLTSFLGVVARDGRQGLSYSVGILFVALLLPPAAYYYWHITLPSVLDCMSIANRWAAGKTAPFALGELGLWSGVALAFPFLSQLILERAEV